MRNDGTRGEMTAFVRAVELGGFSASARLLGLTPSALSKLVTRLELRLGVRLINRTTRKLSLTPEGHAFFCRCRAILDDIQNAEDEVTRSRERPRGRLRVHVAVGFAMHQFVPAMPLFSKRYPEVEVDLVIEDGTLDLAREGIDISIRPGPSADSPVVARKLFDFERVICASPEYVSRRGRPQAPDDLVTHDCIALSGFGNRTEWPFSTPAGRRVVDIVPRVRVNNADCALRLALLGLGVVRLNEFVPVEALREGRLVPLLQEFRCREPAAMLMLYQRNRHRLPRVAVMLEFLTASFAHAPWRQEAAAERGSHSGKGGPALLPVSAFEDRKRNLTA